MAGRGITESGRELRPSSQLKTLYYLYAAGLVSICVLPWYVPILFLIPMRVALGVLLVVTVAVTFVAYWIPKYVGSISYTLTDDEIVFRRGVWFRVTSVVPYNRITNIDLSQGPVSRALGIADLRVQTAGYSYPSRSSAEMRIVGVENPTEVLDLIEGLVRGMVPTAVETYETGETGRMILKELSRIRELLEKSRGR